MVCAMRVQKHDYPDLYIRERMRGTEGKGVAGIFILHMDGSAIECGALNVHMELIIWMMMMMI